ncbi:MAG TPA: SDR family oxidoreductase [Chthonomonadaceae bacterium]|nr:SDR family oxidoreductase [Chthonomonadaceae bacterium]
MSVKVLFIGGTGIISSACSSLAVEKGLDLYLLNRGTTASRPIPDGATVLNADIRDPASVRSAIEGHTFDVLVDWIAYTPEQVETDLELFRGRTGQYIFISSASAYQTPPTSLPITESTVLANPFWAYSRNKIACEERLIRAYREENFPATIVRPSHTYDRTTLPLTGGYTAIHRMRQGKPVVVHGDGTSLWTLTHHKDFAKGFVGLLGNPRAVGEAFHITSDEVVTWDQIYRIFAAAAGAPPPTLVHVPSEVIAAYDSRWGDGLLGDKAHSMVFDNTKIKRFVPDFAAGIPLSWGAKEILAWYDADPARQVVDTRIDGLIETLIEAQKRALPPSGS